ncbi:MAG TPA: hypothetical protein VK982_06990 [Bacteroidales bacterium]|nr:hypothetical protein [Bacteroidales bacterium]
MEQLFTGNYKKDRETLKIISKVAGNKTCGEMIRFLKEYENKKKRG